MSFGYGVGDIIAVGELCFKLYRQVYQIAKGAPEELRSLQVELSEMTNIIKALTEDLQQPSSAIAQAGPDRLSLMNQIMERTNEVLRSLDGLSKKFDVFRPSPNGTRKSNVLRRNWNKFQYAKEVRTINDLRTKLSYQRGLLTLLLLAGNNSSLERIQSQNAKISALVEEIKAQMYGVATTPVTVPQLQGMYDDQFRFEVTKKMMEKAEINGTAWLAIGISEWLQSGKWWLMKAQVHLYNAPSGSRKQHQSYTDLLKASWILTDVLAAHPQMAFISSGTQQLDIQHLGRVITAEHKRFEQFIGTKPRRQDILSADFTIWGSGSRTSLVPKLDPNQIDRAHNWSTASGEILYQKFGQYVSRYTGIEMECVVILEAEKGTRSLNLIAQISDGQDVLRQDMLGRAAMNQFHIQAPTKSDGRHYIVLSRERPLGFESGADIETFDALIFADIEAARALYILVISIIEFRSMFPASTFDARSLHGAALLKSLCNAHSSEKEEWTAKQKKDIVLLSEGISSHITESDLSDLWNLAVFVAQQPGRPPSFSDPQRHYGIALSPISLICWASPSAECYFTALDWLLADDWYSYRGEILQAAIYREDYHFLLATLDRLKLLQKEPVNHPHSASINSFTRLLFQNRAPILDLCGHYILSRASLRLGSSELLQYIADQFIPGEPRFLYSETPRELQELRRLVSNATLLNDILACRAVAKISPPIPLFGEVDAP